MIPQPIQEIVKEENSDKDDPFEAILSRSKSRVRNPLEREGLKKKALNAREKMLAYNFHPTNNLATLRAF